MSQGKKNTKIIAAVLSVVMAFSAVSFQVGAATKTPAEYQKQADELQKKLDSIKGDQSKQKEYQDTLTEQITTINEKIDTYQRQIANKNTEIANKNAKIAELDAQIIAKQAEIDAKNTEIGQKETERQSTLDLLKDRMRASYMSGQTSTLDVLLSSDDFGKFLSSMEYIKRITVHDKDLMNTLKTQVAEIEAARVEVEKSKQEVEANKASQKDALDEIEAERLSLTSMQTEQENSVKELKTKLSESTNASDKLSESYQKTEQDKIDIEKARQAAEEEIKKAAENSKPSGGGNTGNGGNSNNGGNTGGGSNTGGGGNTGGNGSSDGSQSSSGFAWPLPGHSYISSPYGPRTGTFSGFHTGIDMPAPSGTPIVAAKAGTVVKAYHNSTPSYGKYVLIDHGDGILTLYAHCSSLSVNIGDQVSQGQKIGGVGTTGDSTGNHLHFEIRIGGNHVNPSNYL